MSKEISFYEKDYVNLETKFFRYMDTLVTHKRSSRLLIIIFYSQLISGFFCEQIQLLKEDKIPDNYFMLFQNIIRIRDLFKSSYNVYQLILYLGFILLILVTLLFAYKLKNTGKRVFYSSIDSFINGFLQIFYYILFQPFLDFSLTALCFGKHNPNFTDESITCSVSDKIPITIIAIIVLLYCIFLEIFLSIYYNESFMLSNNPLSRISTKYDMYLVINIVFFSIILAYSYYLGPIVFLIYNLILSIVLLKFFIENQPYYDQITSFIILFFHMLYVWASSFGVFFYIVKGIQLSITFLVIGILVALVAKVKHYQMNEEITLNYPFTKLRNKQSILIYIKNLITKMNTIESNQEDKAEIIGIVHLHKIECPLVECPSKVDKKKYYLPITDEWSKPGLLEFNDRVYLNNFIIFIYDFFIAQNMISSDILMNLSLYYLQIIGNHCQAMYYCQKTGNEKLSLEEKFMHFRTSELISKALIKTFKPSNEIASSLEEMDTSKYFKYQDLSEKFFSEISSDISISTEFWRLFITKDLKRKKLDFNKVFNLTDKIKNTKQRIDNIWKDLFETYNGCNELFELYECYVEYINDDDFQIRDLLKIRNKNFALEGIFNYYKIMFDHETGVIIASGDRGKEGMIEKVSENLTNIFQFNEEELKGMNVGFLMPRMFEKDHRRFMQRSINVGEKRVIDKSLKTFAKDKYNNLIVINILLKLFPILNESTFFCALITKENLDDVILLDQEYNIQGMTDKLYNLFKLNQNIFQDCDVPFWMICKEFIHHYQTFMRDNPLIKYNYSKKTNNDENSNSIYTSTKSALKSATSNIETTTQLSNGNNQQNKNLNNAELDFEINENAEVQWEIIIPSIFKMYNAEENKQQNFISMTIGIQRDESENNTSDLIMESREDENEYGDENNKMLPNNQVDDSSGGNKSITQSYGQDHDKEFQNYIGRYRSSFFNNSNNNDYKNLISMLDKLNEGNEQIFKFTISFSQIRYGEGKLGYCVRCIDNKNEGDLSSDEKLSIKSEGGDNKKLNEKNEANADKPKANVFDRKKYLNDLKTLEEITEEDIKSFKEKLNNFHKLSFEDEKIKTSVDNYHQEILLLSRVLGANAEAIMDENGSQSSSASQFTNSITKKSRVQEIKSHIMINVKKFYTLRLITLLFILIMILSVSFTIFYIFKFDDFLNKTIIIDNLHSVSFIRLFNYISIVSLINSLKGISEDIHSNYTIGFNKYTSSNSSNISQEKETETYSQIQREIIKGLYDDLIETSNTIELNYTREIKVKSNSEFIWEDINEGFVLSNETNKIGLSMSISQTLSYINRLINSNIRFPKYNKSDTELERKVNYTLRKIIGDTYKNELPSMIKLINQMSSICSEENKRNSSTTNSVIIIYLAICCLCSLFYALLLFLTNKNMEDGMKVVSRIDPLLINETLQNIDTFNKTILSKFREISDKENVNNLGKRSANFTETNLSTLSGRSNEGKNMDNEDEEEEEVDFYDNSAYKKLNVLTYSYFQILILLMIFCLFIVPVFIESRSFVNNANNFLKTKEYFFNYFNKNALDILNIKIKITDTEINENEYLDFYLQSNKDKKIVITQINKYNELYKFYTEKYISTICSVLFNDNNTKYIECLNDQKISEYCSIEDLLKLIQEYIYNINKDFNIKNNNEYNGYIEFNNINFELLEYVHNNYFLLIPKQLHNIFSNSIYDFIQDKRETITKILIFMCVFIVIFSFYIMFYYKKSLINLLSISRCIFKIIPTKVINKTKELEEWIDDKY